MMSSDVEDTHVLDDESTENDSHQTDVDDYKIKLRMQDLNRHKNAESWTKNQEYLMQTWADKAAGYRWLHNNSHLYFKNWENMMTYPIIILSCLSGIGGFSIITEKPSMYEIVFQYIFSACNFLVAIFTSFQRINAFPEKADHHLKTAIQFSKYYRMIKLELCLDKELRSNSIEFCNECKNEYDKLTTTAPEIPLIIIEKFNKRYPNIANRPDITNGLHDLDQQCVL